MVDVKKGQKIWIELSALEDMKREEQEMIWKIYNGKLLIDRFEATNIIIKEDCFVNRQKVELTKKLLELELLDTHTLNNQAYNGGGF